MWRFGGKGEEEELPVNLHLLGVRCRDRENFLMFFIAHYGFECPHPEYTQYRAPHKLTHDN